MMAYRPNIDDESVLRRWMGIEAGRINDALVAERKTLARLLDEKVPSSTTKGGKEYAFDREVIRTLGDRLPPEMHDRLWLPIVFSFSPEVRDSFYLRDGTALLALKTLGELGAMREFHEGRLWVSNAIVYAMMSKYPTVIQIGIG
ncbi:DUF61 family protein [Methanofollis ethanolicus]|uniref:DUF61 family protein n=1 Tax=Methanofollis ethanolicus TaxID=488124 RepID=UPI001F3FDFD4|nr:DUF61 family protein [Methanofollis ethanolicus]